MRKSLFLLIILAISASPAVADLMPQGPAMVSNSWIQDFSINDTWQFFFWELPGTFDALTIEMADGILEIPAMTNMSTAMSIVPSATYDVLAFGNDVRTLDFTLNFEGDMADPVSFDLTTWDRIGGQYWQSGWAEATWDDGWSIWDRSAWLDAESPAVDLGAIGASVTPVPSAVLLGVLGLSVAGVKLRKYA